MTQNRWKSKVLWGAIVAQAIVLADITGLWQLMGVDRTAFTDAAAAVLQLLVIVGIVNDPTNPQGW